MEKFINLPNLPNSKVSLAVVDGRIPKCIEKSLYKRKIKLIKTHKIDSLYDAISYHPDIMMCHIGDNKIVVAKNIPNKLVYELENEGFQIIEGKNEVSRKYPLDVFYNVCINGNDIICNEKYTDSVLLEKFYLDKKRIINVNQGYTKCSVSIASKGVFVTSDIGIHTILIREKKESLLISPKFIDLFNMDYGFIGGASGKISHNEVGFFGDLSYHKDHDKIKVFLESKNNKFISLGENKLVDLGTLIPLKEYNGI